MTIVLTGGNRRSVEEVNKQAQPSRFRPSRKGGMLVKTFFCVNCASFHRLTNCFSCGPKFAPFHKQFTEKIPCYCMRVEERKVRYAIITVLL